MNFKYGNSKFHICVNALMQGPHPSRNANLVKTMFYVVAPTLRLLDLLKICWNDDIFIPTPSLCI